MGPNNCNWENTYALDVVPNTTEVLAPADGVVSHVDNDPCGLGGRELAIRHTGPTGKPFESVFLHLSQILVAKGQEVVQGQVIAKSQGIIFVTSRSEKGGTRPFSFGSTSPERDEGRATRGGDE